MESWSLYDQAGHRKYLTGDERRAFLRSLRDQPAEVRTFCRVLCETGCRVSEALSLTVEQIDTQAGMVIIESLKKRRHGVHRAVPVSEDLLGEREGHGSARRARPGHLREGRLVEGGGRAVGQRIGEAEQVLEDAGVAVQVDGRRRGPDELELELIKV